jgi:hypothetical protein
MGWPTLTWAVLNSSPCFSLFAMACAAALNWEMPDFVEPDGEFIDSLALGCAYSFRAF